jgi:two-component system CheB/CheR fusion protein
MPANRPGDETLGFRDVGRLGEPDDQAGPMRDLALALTTTEQRERARISQILHDHLQPLIHGAKMWAEVARDEPDTTPADALARIVALLDEALAATRSLAVDLSPPVLHGQGLAAAYEWLADHVADRHGLQVRLALAPDLAVEPGDLRTLLFDVTRELLFNVVKHAGVDTAGLAAITKGSAGATDRTVCIEVTDEGRGFDPSAIGPAPDPDGGFGLPSIRERIGLLGGTVTIDAEPGRGTRVCVRAPLHVGADP